MARFNTQSITTSVTGAGTVASPQAFTALNGTAPYTVTLPSPVLFPGSSQTFYNATAGTVTISTPSGLFGGLGASGAGTLAIPTNTVVSVTSDGVNYIVLSEDGSALVATTGSFTGNVTANGASATVSLTPQTVTIAPTGASTIDNINIGASTRGSGAFNTLTANSAVTLTANTTSSSTGTGSLVVTGGVGVSGAVYAAGLYGPLTGTVQTAAQTNITSVGTLTALTVNALTVNGVASLNGRTTVRDTINADTSYPLGIQNGSQQPWFLRALTTSNKFSIHLNGTGDLVTVDTAGNVGIGQSSPTVKLDILNTNATYSLSQRIFNASAGQFWIGQSPAATFLSVDNFAMAFCTNSNGGVAGSSVPTNERMRIDSIGNVGMGTGSPLGKLHISTTDMFAAYKTYSGLGNTGAGDAVFEAYRLDGALLYKRVLDIVALGDSANSRESETRFFTTNLAGSTAERLRITGAGNVGIGVTSPAYKLHVAGTSAVSSLDLNAVSTQLGISAVDVFVYDTRKDSDGGAWRKRTQRTSWYNEALNSATRGARREFPAVAVIVATTATITIYDGDSPDLPLWITYPANSFGWDNQLKKVNALNGIVAVANYAAPGYSGNGLRLLNFVSDIFINDSASITYSGQTGGRRVGLASTLDFRYQLDGIRPFSSALSNYEALWVAITVLPNAPVDTTTGLPVPTIAVATQGGVSVIKDTGTVVNIVPDTLIHDTPRNIYFTPTNELWYTGGNNYDPSDRYFHIGPIPATSVTQNYHASSPVMIAGFRRYAAGGEYFGGGAINGAHLFLPYDNLSPRTGSVLSVSADTLFAAGKGSTDNGGVAYIYENKSAPTTGMIAHITSKYSSGWMVGDIKGAWLSDTTQEAVVSSNLITNGTFDSATTGWSTALNTYGTLSIVSGKLRITNSTTQYGGCVQAITTVVGKTYAMTRDFTAGTSPNGVWSAGTYDMAQNLVSSNSALATQTLFFTATGTTTYINYYNGSNTAGHYADIDNVVVQIADADRSINNKGLQVFGTITKTSVATGADLVAYSGFNGSTNYLEQSYNSSLNFGTGDFSYMCWVDLSNLSGSQCLFIRSNTSSGTQGLGLYIENGTWAIFVGSGSNTSILLKAGLNFITVKRIGGIVSFYVDGVLRTGVFPLANNTNFTDTAAILRVGAYFQLNSLVINPSNKIALLRISATAPSDAQILKIYNDEKHLFQESAKATLYGASDNVTALAYDADTQLLHVGTSSGRSVFNGLRRVDNTATAVATSISASNGLVAEQ